MPTQTASTSFFWKGVMNLSAPLMSSGRGGPRRGALTPQDAGFRGHPVGRPPPPELSLTVFQIDSAGWDSGNTDRYPQER